MTGQVLTEVGKARFGMETIRLSTYLQIEGEAVNNHEWIKKFGPDYLYRVLVSVSDALKDYLMMVKKYEDTNALPISYSDGNTTFQNLQRVYGIQVNCCIEGKTPSQFKLDIIEALNHYGLQYVEDKSTLLAPLQKSQTG